MIHETNTDIRFIGSDLVSPDSRIESDYFYKMALEFICFSELHEFSAGKIEVPASVTHWRCRGGKIKFYGANPSAPESLNTVPEGATKVRFGYYSRSGRSIYYGEPTFFDEYGNVLNGASVD